MFLDFDKNIEIRIVYCIGLQRSKEYFSQRWSETNTYVMIETDVRKVNITLTY